MLQRSHPNRKLFTEEALNAHSARLLVSCSAVTACEIQTLQCSNDVNKCTMMCCIDVTACEMQTPVQ